MIDVEGDNNARLSQGRLIEHVVIYKYDASSATELSLSVGDRVWVSHSFYSFSKVDDFVTL